MKVRKMMVKDIGSCIELASKLNKWFTSEAIKNMKIDLMLNNTLVVSDKKEIVGFICYSTYEGTLKLLWIAVKEEKQNLGIGSLLLNYLKDAIRKFKLTEIEVRTLTDKVKYGPYKLTREFYYKNGFKKSGYQKAKRKGWDDQIIMEMKI